MGRTIRVTKSQAEDSVPDGGVSPRPPEPGGPGRRGSAMWVGLGMVVSFLSDFGFGKSQFKPLGNLRMVRCFASKLGLSDDHFSGCSGFTNEVPESKEQKGAALLILYLRRTSRTWIEK